MKKILKAFILIPIFLFAISFFACGEMKLESISLSLPNYQLIGGYYKLSCPSEVIEISANIKPNSFTIKNLEWESDNIDVATVSQNKLRVRGIGFATITALYKNSDGSVVRGTLKVNVGSQSNGVNFPSSSATAVYTGEDLKDNYKVIQDINSPSSYTYSYTSPLNQPLNKIVDVGVYLIECENLQDPLIKDSMVLYVVKKQINISAGSYQTIYGDELPANLFNLSDIPQDFKTNSEVGIEINGVGKDADSEIGKYVEVCEATRTSNAANYEVNLHFALYDEYKANYEDLADILPGSLRINKREVVLKASDQEISYGNNILNSFTLYNNSDYVSNGSSLTGLTVLSNEVVNFSSNIRLGAPSVKKDGITIVKNAANYYDVLSLGEGEYDFYDLSFEGSAPSSTNLKISLGLSGKMKIVPREVVILPTNNQSKVYGEPDPETISYAFIGDGFMNGDAINNFLNIDYTSHPENHSLAQTGKYFYKIDSSKNPNYNIVLDSRAVEEIGHPSDDKRRFEVVKCEIRIELEDCSAYFCTPTGAVSENEKFHTVSYYSKTESGATADYIIKLKSIKINNKEKLEFSNDNPSGDLIGETFENEGYFLLPTGGSFRFGLRVEKRTNTNYYQSYWVFLESISFKGGADGNANFTENFVSSKLNLNKIILTITPKETPSLFSKTYDAQNEIPAGFGGDYNLSENIESNITIEDILEETASVLSLQNESGKFLKIEDGVEKEVSNLNSGSYKVFLSDSLTYKKSMEYYDFILDNTKNFVFVVNKYQVKITPNSNQFKIYAGFEPELEFTYSEIPDLNPAITGSLTRESGEDAGNFKILLGGTLSFGSNYQISLDNDDVFFEIKPREVEIEPIRYVTNYGDVYPSNIGFYERILGEYNSAILKAPVYEGEFKLEGTSSSSGGIYPVKFENGIVVPYLILQGSKKCNSNFEIKFIEGSTFLVQKRNVVLNIISQSKNLSDIQSESETDFDSDFFTITGLVGEPSYQLDLTLTLGDVVCKVETATLYVYKNGTDVSNCYEVSLGADIVYNINVSLVYLSIVERFSKEDSPINVVYNGEYRNSEYLFSDNSGYSGDFTLICDSENYTLDYENSSFIFKYANAQSSDNPKNVGSYIASIDFSNSKIVIKRPNGEPLEFEEADEVKSAHVLSIKNYGYLNITKADIEYEESELGFVENLCYNTDNLSNVKDTYFDFQGNLKNIFTGKGDDIIELKTFNGQNFTYRKSAYQLLTFLAGQTYYINVTVSATNTNYNELNINVPLLVESKRIEILEAIFDYNKTITGIQTEQSVVYNGVNKSIELILETVDNLSNYLITNTYQKLKTTYQNSALGKVSYYETKYEQDNARPDISGGEKFVSFSDIKSISSLELKNYSGQSFIFLNNYYWLLIDEDLNNAAPTNAGVYVAFANCMTYENYTFLITENSVEETKNSVTFATLFEVEKSTQITLNNWKDKFYFTTVFNLSDPDAVPFRFEMLPDFKSQIEYEKPDSWPTNNILNVGEYSVILKINNINENYYLNILKEFEVVPLEAEIVFPTLKTYVYISENSPITSFLTNIKVVLKDKDKNPKPGFYYPTESSNFTFSYFEANSETMLGSEAPANVGDYILKVLYKDEDGNYEGEGEFYYTILKKAYSGFIRFQNSSIVYNPTLTAQELYDMIVSQMFSIGLSEGYSLSLSFNGIDKTLISPENSDWVSEFNKCGQKTLFLTVEFDDGITANYTASATLNITKFVLNSSDFFVESSSYVYDGNEHFGQVFYKGLDLSPYGLEFNTSIGRYDYHFTSNSKIISLEDNLGNTIFNLEYKYFSWNDSYVSMSYVPIIPDENSYKIEYSFNFGDNYNGAGVSITNKIFKIEKANLYISFSGPESIVYTGENFANNFENNQIIVRNDSSSNETNMKVSTTFSSGVGYDISGTDGVYLYIYFSNFQKEKIDNVTNVGTYYINISLLYSQSYDISKFFNNINLSGIEAYPVIEFINNHTYSEYGYKIEKQFKVTQAQSPFDISNLLYYVSIPGATIDNQKIYFDKTSEISGIDLQNYQLLIYKYESGSLFLHKTITSADLPFLFETYESGEYAFVVVDTNGNYKKSSYIDFIIN